MARSKKKSKTVKNNLLFELYGILIIIFSVIAMAIEGPVGESLHYMFGFMAGESYYIFPFIGIYIGLFAMIKRSWPRWSIRKTGVLLILLGILLSAHIGVFANKMPDGGDLTSKYIFSTTLSDLKLWLKSRDFGSGLSKYDAGGGMIGASLYSILHALFASIGTRLINIAFFAIGIMLATGLSYVDFGQKLRERFGGTNVKWKDRFKAWLRKRHEQKVLQQASASAAISKKTAQTPYIPIEDEFDEENFVPVHKAKKPGFFQLFDSPAKVNRGSKGKAYAGDDDWDFEPPMEEVVYSAEPHAVPAAAQYESSGETAFTPVIRSFDDHKDEAVQTMNPIKQVQPLHNDEASLPDATLDAVIDESLQPVKPKAAPLKKPYELPALKLLMKPALGKNSEMSDYKANARKLEATLESFGVRAKVLEVVRGPAVTRYEIQPDVGVKVSRIVSLTDDIALALAAKDIRMEAPIPGKAAIGIEVPNSEVSIVTMREVMETGAFQESNSRLSIVLGRDISGQPIVGNLAKMPHLLVAGATGSGKSVCINGIITSILYKAKPNEVKFLMVDPKMVELNVYNGIPHLLAPVVTDPRRASLALKKIVVEMEKRYELFSKSGTRNIEGYNAMLLENGTEAPLPYIVVIVDELADLMMVAANDVEDAICRLAQMARASGIHLIIATQRPSVDVITGVIKANIPSRIAFGVSSQVDSRTILDMVGAEKLLGRGDMLYLPVGASKPVRVQGAFLSDQEVESVVTFVRKQEEAHYQEELVPQIEDVPDGPPEYEDELFEQAVQILIEAKQASVSLLQRRMRIGYSRAARLIDSMEAKGIVGPYEGSKPREILISMEQFQQTRISS